MNQGPFKGPELSPQHLHQVVTIACNFKSKGSEALFWPHSHSDTLTQTHIIFLKINEVIVTKTLHACSVSSHYIG